MAGRGTRGWMALSALAGAFTGLGAFTFHYAGGFGYLGSDPATCAQCHLMNDPFDSWRKGPHHAVATCSDCHLPSPFVPKYLAKARNGYHHSMGFTLQPPAPDDPGARTVFPEPIRIKDFNSQVLQDNCLRCHGEFTHGIVRGSTGADHAVRCVHCHDAVGHGARR
ncbi:MAG TPA: cytochrome c nitrite reductase small subunit [Myxococcota bacterium]|nr:cytochrome c nitrite reductase small subunit [Myxococcota bacterium]HQK49591.1 cytochrome c nitrite reductase small subunit [Myxococcota bacterium]